MIIISEKMYENDLDARCGLFQNIVLNNNSAAKLYFDYKFGTSECYFEFEEYGSTQDSFWEMVGNNLSVELNKYSSGAITIPYIDELVVSAICEVVDYHLGIDGIKIFIYNDEKCDYVLYSEETDDEEDGGYGLWRVSKDMGEVRGEVRGPDQLGNTEADYEKAERECPEGHRVVWNKYEKGYVYRKVDKDGYVIDLPEN